MLSVYKVNRFFEKLRYFQKISPHQKCVIDALLSFFGKNGIANPSIPLIAQSAGVCETTVKKTLREFRCRGWIDWRNTRKGRRQSSNVYTITILGEAVDKLLQLGEKVRLKSKVIRQFFSRHRIHNSPYYEIKRMANREYSRAIPEPEPPPDPPLTEKEKNDIFLKMFSLQGTVFDFQSNI